jgi:hypothetical protein
MPARSPGLKNLLLGRRDASGCELRLDLHADLRALGGFHLGETFFGEGANQGVPRLVVLALADRQDAVHLVLAARIDRIDDLAPDQVGERAGDEAEGDRAAQREAGDAAAQRE